MPIYIPENDITLNAETDTNEINVTVEDDETIIEISLDGDGEVFALEAKTYRDQALVYATSAETYRNEAVSSAESASTSATTAANSATRATDSATLSRSWAVGGTGTRTGEDSDNSKFYAQTSGANATLAEQYAGDAEGAVETIRQLTIETTFSVDFTTGELLYTSPGFTFEINTTTGNLEWEVAI